MSAIKSGSSSRLSDYEQCALRAQLKYVSKIPEPERALPPGKTEHANDRGTRIHQECEDYVRGTRPGVPVEAKGYEAELQALKRSFDESKAELEGEWGFDESWEPCDYRSAWLRVKCDAVVHMTPTHILVVDFKTGRKFGNEIKHGEQVQLYAIAAAMKYPMAETIDVELWYFDQKEGENYTHESKPRGKWLYQQRFFHNRLHKMITATEFPPNPNAVSCKWCPYKEGICPHAVTSKVPPRRKGQPR